MVAATQGGERRGMEAHTMLVNVCLSCSSCALRWLCLDEEPGTVLIKGNGAVKGASWS